MLRKKLGNFLKFCDCVVVLSSQILFLQITYGSKHLNFCHEVLFRSEKTENDFFITVKCQKC